MSDASPYLQKQPVSDGVRRVQAAALLVKGPLRAADPGPPPAQHPRKTLLERKSRKA